MTEIKVGTCPVCGRNLAVAFYAPEGNLKAVAQVYCPVYDCPPVVYLAERITDFVTKVETVIPSEYAHTVDEKEESADESSGTRDI